MIGRRLLPLALALLVAGGCSRLPFRGGIPFRGLAVQVDREANEQSPVPTELVIVVDAALAERLSLLPAEEWFRQREQIRRDFPQGFRSLYWELVPGQSLVVDPIPLSRSGAVAVFLFARYTSEGDHRLRLDPVRRAEIQLAQEGPVLQNPSP